MLLDCMRVIEGRVEKGWEGKGGNPPDHKHPAIPFRFSSNLCKITQPHYIIHATQTLPALTFIYMYISNSGMTCLWYQPSNPPLQGFNGYVVKEGSLSLTALTAFNSSVVFSILSTNSLLICTCVVQDKRQ